MTHKLKCVLRFSPLKPPRHSWFMGDTSRPNWIFKIPNPFVWRALMAGRRDATLMRRSGPPGVFSPRTLETTIFFTNKQINAPHLALAYRDAVAHTAIHTHLPRGMLPGNRKQSRPPPPLSFIFIIIFLFWSFYQWWEEEKGNREIKSKPNVPLVLNCCCCCRTRCPCELVEVHIVSTELMLFYCQDTNCQVADKCRLPNF